ncbi:MAG: 50S ribosomal protein L18 [Acidobacteriia bacterium]|jgi:large subunit ribosomal protein L18|nr:50S ribosomal protein L18 [Terriglobia bacterium]
MDTTIDRRGVRRRIRYRIRSRVRGSAARPRLAVFRSDKHIYVQAIDDDAGRTLAQASTAEPGIKAVAAAGKKGAAKAVGGAIAERLKTAGIETAVFDRGGFLYHGRVKALAEAAREAGLKF